MYTIKIDILNPKTKKLLKSLVDLKLIAIRDTSKNGFADLLNKLRTQTESNPILEEITKEVELVRSKRYGKEND